ncbi:MAG: hypothetical protein AAF367_10910 [Pseudomonadota bacterium]
MILSSAVLAALALPAAADGCSFKTASHLMAMRDLTTIESIEVRTLKYRKWVKNGLAILTSRTPNIPDELKQNFKAKITVNYPFGTCRYDARIRQNGDWKDHIRFRKGRIDRSLDVRMKTGNVGGIVRFKLLLPETRQGRNEIFATEALRMLGFLSPRTFVTDVIQDGAAGQMLFQEKPSKELLEAHGRREGPLFEGEEALLWGWGGYAPIESKVMKQFGLARLTNDAWAARGKASASMSATALSRLQAIFARIAFSTERDYSLPLTEFERHRPAVFEAVLFALNGRHGLSPHNRQFYWNALANEFEPIYYDGDVSAEPLVVDDIRPEDIRYFARTLTPKRLNDVRMQVNAIDSDLLRRTVEDLTHQEIQRSEVETRLRQMDQNLLRLMRLLQSAKDTTARTAQYDIEAELLDRAKTVISEATVSSVQGFTPSGAQIRTCDASHCDTSAVSLEVLADRMSGSGLRNTEPLDFFLGGVSVADSETTLLEPLELSVRHASGARVVWDDAQQELSFIQDQVGDWFLIEGGVLNNITINFVAASGRQAAIEQRFNEFGVTGCLTFFDVEFRNPEISASGGGCEDVVNIVGGHGEIQKLTVAKAPFDAIDLDFVNIEVAQVHIQNAGNDCLDVSSGHYEIGLMVAEDCGDKGLSVGEASRMTVHEMTLSRSGIGVSSKDSSAVDISLANFLDTPLCFEAYKKKQEFDGAILRFGSLACDGSANVDAMSITEISGKQM